MVAVALEEERLCLRKHPHMISIAGLKSLPTPPKGVCGDRLKKTHTAGYMGGEALLLSIHTLSAPVVLRLQA